MSAFVCQSPIPYNVGSGRLYSSEEEEQTQRESNAQVEVDKVVELLNQLFSVETHNIQMWNTNLPESRTEYAIITSPQ